MTATTPPKMRQGLLPAQKNRKEISPGAKANNPGYQTQSINAMPPNSIEEAQPLSLGAQLAARLDAASPATPTPTPTPEQLPKGGIKVRPPGLRPADQVRQAERAQQAPVPSSGALLSSLIGPPPAVVEAVDAPKAKNDKVAPAAARLTHKILTEEGFTRVELPSRCKMYKFKDIFARPLFVGELAALNAANVNDSFTMIIDALAPALSVDIRELTGPDFRFMMYWWRLNSFLNSPYTFRWYSRYGNLNQRVMSTSNQEIVEMTISDEELAKYAEKGIRYPLLRDEEAIKDSSDVKGVDRWLLLRAQYVALTPEEEQEALNSGQWFTKRIEKLSRKPAWFLEDIRSFTEQTAHGVKESFEAESDDKFNPEKAAVYLRERVDMLAYQIDNASANVQPKQIEEMIQTAADYTAEADEIEAAINENKLRAERNEEPVAIQSRKEVINITMKVMDFFPTI